MAVVALGVVGLALRANDDSDELASNPRVGRKLCLSDVDELAYDHALCGDAFCLTASLRMAVAGPAPMAKR